MAKMKPTIEQVGDWLLGKTLGRGHYGKVKLGLNLKTGVKAAVKIVDIKHVDKEIVMKEQRILKYMDHPNIVQLYEVHECQTTLCMVLELADGGELFDYIVARKRLSENEARFFMKQLVSAVEYIHAHCIIHRDLKLENILLDLNGNVKIADFGLSNWVTPGELHETCCGSPQYCAPEILHGGGYVGPEADIWSLGVILYAMVCGRLPFWRVDNGNLGLLLKAANECNFEIDIHVSAECCLTIEAMLEPDGTKRVTLQELCRSRWMRLDGPYKSHLPEFDGVKEVDPDIMMQLAYFGFKPVDARAKIIQNVTSQETTMYHLLAEKKRKNQMKSCLDPDTALPRPPLKSKERRNSIGNERMFRLKKEHRHSRRSLSAAEGVIRQLWGEITDNAKLSDSELGRKASKETVGKPAQKQKPAKAEKEKRRPSTPTLSRVALFNKARGDKIPHEKTIFSSLTKKHGPATSAIMEDLGAQLEALGTKYKFTSKKLGQFVYICTKDIDDAAFRLELVQVVPQSVYAIRCRCERGSILAVIDVCYAVANALQL